MDDLLAEAPRPGLVGLDRLDGVAWGSLQHAYGVAGDVPAMIRALAAARTPEQVGKAEGPLWSSVLHQGNVYDSTPVALPFVLAILADHAPARLVLAEWLTDACWTLEDDDRWARFPEVGECRKVLVRAAPSLVHLLEADDTEVRSLVAHFLGWCTDAAVVLWPALRSRLEVEPDIGVGADLLVSLGHLAMAADRVDELRTLVAPWRGSDDPRRRCAAAQARLEVNRDDEEALAVLVEALPTGCDLDSMWGVGEAATIVRLLGRSGVGFADARTRSLVLRAVARAGEFRTEQMMRPVLAGVFPGGRKSVPRSASSLTPDQRDVIALLASGEVPFTKGNHVDAVSSLAREYRLPPDHEKLRAWLDSASFAGDSPPH